MIPSNPADNQPAAAHPVSAQAMACGGTFVRPGAVAWGSGSAAPGAASSRDPGSSPEAVEQVLSTVVKDSDRMRELLDELSHARLWLPLPEDRPVTDGSAVALPTVVYLSAEFVPAFTSAQRLSRWGEGVQAPRQLVPAQHPPAHSPGRRRPGSGLGAAALGARPGLGAGPGDVIPHIVVPAAELARRLPAGLGIALNPGAGASVPIYPEGVAYLAAAEVTAGGAHIRVGDPPAEPVALLREVRGVLQKQPAVQQASRAWLSVPGQGEGLVISVALDDPASEPDQDAAAAAIEHAVAAVSPQAHFPIDVTFPGGTEPDEVDQWIAAYAFPFYIRD